MAIYFVRHAQSEFNVKFEVSRIDPFLYDSVLSDVGIEQAKATRRDFEDIDIKRVIVSPFTRAIQTATCIFENDHPFEISHHVREQLSNTCDVGSTRETLEEKFPHLDFSEIPELWWHQGEKDERGISVEPHMVLLARIREFLQTLSEAPGGSTAIVTHGNFIQAITGQHTRNCEITKYDLNTGQFHSHNAERLSRDQS